MGVLIRALEIGRRCTLGLAAAVFLAALAACGSPGPDSLEPGSPPTEERRPDAPPPRVIAIAPAIVEALYFLDLGEQVVGVGDFATWPPEVADKPRIGGLFDPRLETIAALEPDLAILMMSERGLQEPLERLGVEVMLLDVELLADVEEAIRRIGARLGVEGRVEERLAEWRRELLPAPAATAGARPRVLLSIVREAGRLSGVLTANRETFYQELLERLGAVNVFADAPVRYPQVAAEEIVARAPTVLIELQARRPEPAGVEALLADWMEVPFGSEIPCLRLLAGSHTALPGPRLPQLYRELRAALEECAAERSPG